MSRPAGTGPKADQMFEILGFWPVYVEDLELSPEELAALSHLTELWHHWSLIECLCHECHRDLLIDGHGEDCHTGYVLKQLARRIEQRWEPEERKLE